MKAQFAHELISSFYLWFEGKLLSSDSKAYKTNQQNTFEYVNFKDIPSSYLGYQGRFRQLVADENVDVPNSGVFIDGSFVTGSSSDIFIDYNDGRVIVPQASGQNLNITANNTVKEINTYLSEEDEEQILLTSDFIDSSDLSSSNLFEKTSKRNKKTYILPACFIRLLNETNERLSFGGEDDTTTKVRVIVLAKTNYLLDGVLSLFANTETECVSRIPFEDFPYGYFHNLKNFPYSYSSLSSNYDSKTFIENVSTSKVVDSVSLDKIEENLLLGFIDFDLSTYRYPRA
jgi:hypothetical protein